LYDKLNHAEDIKMLNMFVTRFLDSCWCKLCKRITML